MDTFGIMVETLDSFLSNNTITRFIKSKHARVWARLAGFGIPVLTKSRLLRWADYVLIDDIVLYKYTF